MLRVSIIDTTSQRTLVVEGKLIPPWTTELRTAYDNAKIDLNGRELVVDLKNLTTFSQAGEDLVTELIKEGVQFRGCGLYARLLLRHLSGRARALKKCGPRPIS
jgi:hypothetical protein